MLDFQDAVRGQCPDVPAHLLDDHFRKLPATYFERYSVAEIARHLRLLARMEGPHPVEVETRVLAAQAFEVLLVGADYSGALACIAAAITAHGFDFEDVQVTSTVHSESGPHYFVVVVRVSGSLRGQSPAELSADLRIRLRDAFAYLAEGNLPQAQALAVDTRAPQSETNSGLRRSHPGSSPRVDPYEGMVLGGDFRLERRLTIGGMSRVYLANQISLSRTVAVKIFPHQGSDAELLARFNREATVLAQFHCAHIVQILAAGTTQDASGDGLGWMAMEYLSGGDLSRWLPPSAPPPLDWCCLWLRQALEGLYYAHRQGVLHRDLKPHNLLLTEEGQLKVGDFGLLKQIQKRASGLTPRAAIMGTPHYMSPEQSLGETLDERSDIFSLGSTFFHLLGRRLPFLKEGAALLVQIAQEDAPRLVDVATEAPLPLSTILGRMMARRREERYQDVSVVLEDLASYQRRGLLRFPDSSYLMAPAGAVPNELPDETQPYAPQVEGNSDLGSRV
jgi:hypothetical protein